jgi:hypothetical protein
MSAAAVPRAVLAGLVALGLDVRVFVVGYEASAWASCDRFAEWDGGAARRPFASGFPAQLLIEHARFDVLFFLAAFPAVVIGGVFSSAFFFFLAAYRRLRATSYIEVHDKKSRHV